MGTTAGVRLGRALTGAVLLGSLLIVGPAAASANAASCIATGALDRDGTPLTARIVNPTKPVTGRVDATGCEVGVYFDRGAKGRVVNAEVFGARYYGVLVDGNVNHVSVDVTGSNVHNIGEVPISSARHGQGIAYRAFGGSATGTVLGNRVWSYQEAGINETGPGSTVTITGNRVTGRVTDKLQQNGIQVIFGAHGTVVGNRISDLRNVGTSGASAAGILVAGGEAYGQPYTRGARIEGNVITSSDTGIAVVGADADFNPSPEPTSTVIRFNVIRNDALTNLVGFGDIGYQAGISVYGNGDRIVGNVITGKGYDQTVCGDAAICLPIDTEGSIDPTVSGNVTR